MKISDYRCPKCGGSLWGQIALPEEKNQGIHTRVCLNSCCDYRLKLKINKENLQNNS
jgi:hypothetical protein